MLSPLHVLAFAGVAAVGAVVGWRLTGVRARFTGASLPAPRDGLPFASATAAAFLAVAVFVAMRSTAPGVHAGPSGSGSSGATVVAAGLAAVAYLYFAAVSLLLAEVDVATHRLPNAIVLPAYPVLAILFAAACLAGGSWAPLGRAAAGGGILFGFFWLVRTLGRGAGTGGGRGALGGGDVKLAGVIGMVLGFTGWSALALGALAAFLFGGVAAIALLLCGRATRHTAIAFGPFLLAGAWAGVLGAGGSALG